MLNGYKLQFRFFSFNTYSYNNMIKITLKIGQSFSLPKMPISDGVKTFFSQFFFNCQQIVALFFLIVNK